MRNVLIIAFCLILSAFPATADEGNGPRYWFIGELPASALDRTDWLLLRQNVLLALYELPDGQSVIWVNPARGHSGNARVLTTHPEGDDETPVCRLIRIGIDLGNASEDGVYQLCRSPGGFWEFRPRVRGIDAP